MTGRRHYKRHKLSISNGFGRVNDEPIEVWCGYCKDLFEVDAEWAQRYLDKKERELGYNLNQPGPYGTNQAQYDETMDYYRKSFAYLLEPQEVKP